ncbi:MAG: hypothetical protein WKF58_15730 [Ilumatobacteraceae bacterium]
MALGSDEHDAAVESALPQRLARTETGERRPDDHDTSQRLHASAR